MREHLLGYLVGALDDSEHERVHRELEINAELRNDLERLGSCVEPLGWDDGYCPPPQRLAERTCQMIADHCAAAMSPERTLASLEMAPPSGRWSLADLLVAAGVFLAASVLFFPAVANSHYQAQLANCQNNLRQLSTALVQYSQVKGGLFPHVPAAGKLSAAGVYAPILHDEGFLTNEEVLICPSSPLAQERGRFHVPAVKDLESSPDGVKLASLQQAMGGSYGYVFGYLDEAGQYRPHRNRGRNFFALMSDTPCSFRPDHKSVNHGGCGQNVLYESGRVKYLTQCRAENCNDDLFLSDRGRVEPGRHENDAVIAPSPAHPLITNVRLDK